MKLVLVYAKYCPYSLDFLPKFAKMKTELNKTFKSLTFKTLTKDNYNPSKYNVQSFPSLFLEVDGKIIDLRRNSPMKRTAKHIINSIKKIR